MVHSQLKSIHSRSISSEGFEIRSGTDESVMRHFGKLTARGILRAKGGDIPSSFVSNG
jgi:hypothetical protein